MNKFYILAIGVSLSIILPLDTYGANGIIENSDGSKTITWSDNTRGDIKLTVAGKDLEGYYYWGFNEASYDDNMYEIEGAPSYNRYTATKGLDHDNDWGGGADTPANGCDSGNPRSERQGPCPDGWHVPSRRERNALSIAWCKLDEGCYDSDLAKSDSTNNNFISIYRYTREGYTGGFGNRFASVFNMSLNDGFWASTPMAQEFAYELCIDRNAINPGCNAYRTHKNRIRCFKDNSYIRLLGGGANIPKDNINSISTGPTNMNTGTTNTGTSIPKESNVNTGNRTTNEKIDIDKLNNNKADSKAIIPSQLFTYKQRNQSYGNPSDILENGYTREMNNAYNFAYTNGLISSSNIDKAKMNSPLTRIAMAKMLSNYAINILGKQPDTSKGTKNFNDVTAKQNAEYNNAVTLSYQLGIMGQGTNNNFRPNDEVTRAEFATALSRMLYSTPDGKDNYYSTHLNKLKQQGIITNDNPRIKEKRGYVMLMLMRSVM